MPGLTYTVTSPGPASGLSFTGIRRVPERAAVAAVHGGTYTSQYFDIPGHSLLERAADLGIPIVAIDRPGYGGSTPARPSDSIILTNAEAFDALPDIPMIDLPSPMKDSVMFGPAWTHDAAMAAASHPCDTPVPRAELIDINNGWIGRVRSVASKVTVPVHSRQAEFDHLWITDEQQVKDFGAAFTSSPQVDARLVWSAGHCIDFHRAGAGLQLGQLGFALECSIRPAGA